MKSQNFWNGKRVFITGATGIVGAWLVKEFLAADAYLVVLVRDMDPQSELLRSGDFRHVTIVNGNIEDFRVLERVINDFEIDSIFHLAAQTIVGVAQRNPLPTFEANIRGTYNLLEACRIHRDRIERVVIASSDKAYGEHPRLPYTEAMRLNGLHPYDVSKSCADMLAQSYFHAYDLPVAIARCGNVYGGGDLNWSRIVPGTIRSFFRGEQPVIRSDGKYVRDYIYVKDVARAYVRLAEMLEDRRVRGEGFNFGNEAPLKVLDLVHEIQRLMECQQIAPDIVNRADGEIREQYLSTAKARSILGWKPVYDLESGLRETIEWYSVFLEK